MTPNQRRDRIEQPSVAQPADGMTLDPAFDDLDGADAEWSRWKWPEREQSESRDHR